MPLISKTTYCTQGAYMIPPYAHGATTAKLIVRLITCAKPSHLLRHTWACPSTVVISDRFMILNCRDRYIQCIHPWSMTVGYVELLSVSMLRGRVSTYGFSARAYGPQPDSIQLHR
ncbi:unnamed protein product [Periconia digitata]|uniref:Uncharacterized protein n=1 Tax=Periconia digitata TaxID=1303443 RepID=A0A9W4U8Q8_9PLEO|nr:unnamed protein product [Periconia digitata]